MRRLMIISIVAITTALAAQAGQNWPPSAAEDFIANIYPSREQAMEAVRAHLGADAQVVEQPGALTAVKPGPQRPQKLTVAFVEKPWAADSAAFMNSTRDAVLVGRSTSPCTSMSEAEASAYRAVTSSLLPLVRQQIIQQYAGKQFISDKDLADVIDSHVRAGRLTRDRFVQRFSRPYGDVWYQAVLVDISDARIQPIVHSAVQFTERRIQRIVGLIAAYLLLLVLVAGVYALLNWLTKGYFVWRLRFVAMTVIVMGLITVLALK
ncbi:MAG TPA: hypothetical protein VL282_09960 [Tepidisphaeraceae bacterium]|jgi:hypothetical protein|nr:hypothetical protein [Tepidisphaeraceae bacterium]